VLIEHIKFAHDRPISLEEVKLCVEKISCVCPDWMVIERTDLGKQMVRIIRGIKVKSVIERVMASL
jgi:hypothetical protein